MDMIFVVVYSRHCGPAHGGSRGNMLHKTLIFSMQDLPTEIIIEILSRLPIKSIINCKCVCRSWYQLLQTPEFVSSHFSKSVPGLFVYQPEIPSHFLHFFEFRDGPNELDNQENRFDPVATWDLKSFIGPHVSYSCMDGSINGFLFFVEPDIDLNFLYICNPITREYIEISSPYEILYVTYAVAYGFGLCKVRAQCKIVWVFRELECNDRDLLCVRRSECQVYTLGTGSWRSTNDPGLEHADYSKDGILFNYKLHWLVTNLEEYLLISCFDLETELFKAFYLPAEGMGFHDGCLSVVEDCLSFSNKYLRSSRHHIHEN